jgi:hypothetical protein
LTSAALRTGVGVVLIAVLMGAAPACTNAGESHREASATPTPTTTVRAPCEVALPAAWQEAIETSAVSTGGVSTVPLAVGRAGEVAAVRDNGDTRDLLLVGADKSVREIYTVPDPDENDVGFVGMDDPWIVVGVNRIRRDANGAIASLIRIDVIDRQSGSVRTVAQGAAPGDAAGAARLDSVALFRGKVYWVETHTGTTATVSSYDLGAGSVAEVASGALEGVRTSAAGLTIWDDEDSRRDVKIAAPLPTPVADAAGNRPGQDRQDRVTLDTDGTAYAWVTGLDQGGTGVAWWSPGSDLVRVTGEVVPSVTTLLPQNVLTPLHVVGPYVVLGRGRPGGPAEHGTFATVVDTRSGAVTFLRNVVAGADGGTIALRLGANSAEGGASAMGVVRSDALPRLSC